MKVRLHNPRREVETAGPLHARDLCRQLGLNRESVRRQTETVSGANVALGGEFVYIDPDPVNPDGPVHALPAEAIRHIEFPPSVKRRRPGGDEQLSG